MYETWTFEYEYTRTDNSRPIAPSDDPLCAPTPVAEESKPPEPEKKPMARCIFENLTPEQAATLAEWFEGQGEQDCGVWFDDRGVKSPLADVQRKGGYRQIMPNGDVIVHCR